MSRPALSSEFVDALVSAGVSACAMRVALVLARLQGRNDEAWPSNATLADRAGTDRRGVQRATAELRAAGLLVVHQHSGRGNTYSVSIPDNGAVNTSPAGGGKNDAGGAVNMSPAGDKSVVSHLFLEFDHRSQNTHIPCAPASDDFGPTTPYGRVVSEYMKRAKAAGIIWPGPGSQRSAARVVGEAFGDDVAALEASLDAFFANSWARSIGFDFAQWVRAPSKWTMGIKGPAKASDDVATPITDELFYR